MKKETFICGVCIHAKNGSTPGVKLIEIGPRKKDICGACGKRKYGALCRAEKVKAGKR